MTSTTSELPEVPSSVDGASLDAVDAQALGDLLRTMLRIRLFEQRVADLASAGEIRGPVHLYVGQEAVAAGVCLTLTRDDFVLSTHRSHGHFIAKGGDLNGLMAELFGKETGCSKGRGGSMHLVDSSVGYVASVPIVAGTIPVAVGAALSAKLRGSDQVAVAFFGDGATDEGVFYESINLAGLYDLPILFVCENNLFSTHLPIHKRLANANIAENVRGFALPAQRVDGNNVGDVVREARQLVESIRSGAGPAFLECMTYRWLAHVGPTDDFDVGFRTREQVEHWRARDPIDAARGSLERRGALSRPAYDAIVEEELRGVEDAVQFAQESPFPSNEALLEGLYD